MESWLVLRWAAVALSTNVCIEGGTVGKYHDIFENIEDVEKIRFFHIFDIYRAFAHTLIKYKIYYQTGVCVCALHIR